MLLLNGWLAWHCAALFIAPAATPPSSPLFTGIWQWFGRYVQALYVNHGYHFFAPEPTSSTLLGYRLEFPDGRIETGMIPHKGIEPRLLYHRYFMMTEQMANFDALHPELRRQWIEAYAQGICQETGAVRVSLSRVRHNLPTMLRIRAGGTLDDPDLFEEVFLGTFERQP